MIQWFPGHFIWVVTAEDWIQSLGYSINTLSLNYIPNTFIILKIIKNWSCRTARCSTLGITLTTSETTQKWKEKTKSQNCPVTTIHVPWHVSAYTCTHIYACTHTHTYTHYFCCCCCFETGLLCSFVDQDILKLHLRSVASSLLTLLFFFKLQHKEQ